MTGKREQLISAAREWIGTPFRTGAATKGLGADCGLFLARTGLELGYGHVKLTCRKNALARSLKPFCDEYLVRIKTADRQPGDIALMQMAPGEECKHIGLITEIGGVEGLLHTHSRIGKVVEHHLDKAWLDRIKYVYRVPGID